MKKARESIGILGGTFDPIHKGHLAMAKQVKSVMCLDEVIFVPCKRPPHKKDADITDERHRIGMVKLAVSGIDGYKVSDIEMNDDRPSYTYDTLSEFEREYEGDADLYFIMGADSLFTIETWHRADELLKRFRFIVVNRPDGPDADLKEKISELKERYSSDIKAVHMKPVDICATDIRRNIKTAQGISRLVPPAVERYILEHGLYQE